MTVAALTVWVAGLVPAIVFTDNWPGRYDPQLYVWWIVFLPLAGSLVVAFAALFADIYRWART